MVIMWRDYAMCATLEKDERNVFVLPRKHEEARVYCNACAVQGECLSFALDIEDFEVSVIYGGMNGSERKALANRVANR